MAFDNCTELERWQELTDFAAEMNKSGDRVHFTFFVSGVNFLADAYRKIYESPLGRGLSRINFGGTPDDVRKRIDYVNDLYRQGHEIASHAVGHFNGAKWSAVQWGQEFRSFKSVLGHVVDNNALPANSPNLAVPLAHVVGFRAPYLARSNGLYTVLKENGFRYDTSSDSAPDAWPEKIDGIWRFNLARLKLHNMRRTTLSMDYNFFMLQSRGRVDPKHFDTFREQILQTYLDYFRANYYGNRAPLHIGHHFFDYQGGAYKQALMQFAREVCGLPEVRCVTYAKLADFMDGLKPETLQAYRKGEFPHVGEHQSASAEAQDAHSVRQ